MKLFKPAILTFIMVLYIVPCYAQYNKYHKVGNNAYITTIPNAKLYELSTECNLSNRREIIYTQNAKIKKIKNF